MHTLLFFFFFQAEDGIRDFHVTGVQTCALPISICALTAGCVTRIATAACVTERWSTTARNASRSRTSIVDKIALLPCKPDNASVGRVSASAVTGLGGHAEKIGIEP